MRLKLESSALKIVWAKEHLNTLEQKIGEWRSNHLHKVPIQAYVEGNVNTIRVGLGNFRPESPPGWSLAAGDCIQNLRASLDHILWEIIRKCSKPKVRVGSNLGRKVQFPIGLESARVRIRLAEFKKPPFNLPAEAARLIKRVQPYKAGYKPLSALNRLANRDKHCLLLVAITDVQFTKINDVRLRGDSKLSARPNIPGFDWSQSNILAFQTFVVGSPGPSPEDVEVDGEITARVAFRYKGVPTKPIDIVLESFIECVERIRDQFLGLKL
jgi:hypothetical protein